MKHKIIPLKQRHVEAFEALMQDEDEEKFFPATMHRMRIAHAASAGWLDPTPNADNLGEWEPDDIRELSMAIRDEYRRVLGLMQPDPN